MYTKADFKVGLYMIKDGGPCEPAPRPSPVRYGDLPPPPSFSEVGATLDAAHARLLKLRDALCAARQRK
jgi:hypothetical protein